MGAIYDMKIDQGATYRRVFTWKDEENQPVPLSGSTAKLQVRKDPEDITSVLTLTTDPNGGIVLDNPVGTIEVEVSPSSSNILPSDIYYYDLEIYTGTDTDRILRGKFVVSRQITV